MSGPDVDALLAEALDAMDAGGDFAYEPVGVAGRNAVRSLAALARSAAEMESVLTLARDYAGYGGVHYPRKAALGEAVHRVDDLAAARSREQQEGT